MFAGELKASEARLLAEQHKRKEKERLRLQKERELAERSRQREQDREEQRRLALDAQLAREKEEQDLAWQETEHNRGVYLRVELLALAADESVAITKGIKRSADKVFLPPSVGSHLMGQDAQKNGAPLFQLSTPHGSVTHAGVLEFTAPEGVVLLPVKVARCLFPGGAPTGSVVVKYVRLEKGAFVSFQPLTRGFHEAVDDGVREVLEAALATHCTLSVGDLLEARHNGETFTLRGETFTLRVGAERWQLRGSGPRLHVLLQGETFTLRVQELKPSSAVSVIDTDLEAEVVASLETETHIRDWQAEQQRQADAVVAFAAEREHAAAAAAADVALRAQLVAEGALADSVRRERSRQEKEANLPVEPSASDEDQGPILTCVFRLPDGGRFTRRVRAQDQLQLLFDFVDSKGAGGLESGSYSLVSQFPRRLLPPSSGASTLEQLEMSGGQHSFFVEARTAGSANETMVEGEGVRVS
ncbi:MAG: hypothetical protein WDW36_006150 [Sanguina aurantia]